LVGGGASTGALGLGSGAGSGVGLGLPSLGGHQIEDHPDDDHDSQHDDGKIAVPVSIGTDSEQTRDRVRIPVNGSFPACIDIKAISGNPDLETSAVKHNLGRVLFLVTVATATSMTFGQASKKGADAGVPGLGSVPRAQAGRHLHGDRNRQGVARGRPPLLWKATGIGGGYSSVSVAGKLVFTMGDVGNSCNLIAISAADGKIVWQAKVGQTGGGGRLSRTALHAASDGRMVFALGQYGDLVAVNAVNGAEVWRKNMSSLGGEMMSGWGYSEVAAPRRTDAAGRPRAAARGPWRR
jgi:hypothetical protein